MKIINLAILAMLCLSSITNYNRRIFWKERYEETAVWADSLYEQNIRLSNQVLKLQHHDTIQITQDTIAKSKVSPLWGKTRPTGQYPPM